MGTTSDKLTYLATTKDKLKTTINYTGANITNDTFRSYPEKLYNQYIDIINNGTDTLYSNLPKVSANNVQQATLNNTKQAKMTIDLKGNTQQDSTTGKNLLDNTLVSTSKYGITFTVNEDKTVKVNGTSTAYTFVDLDIDLSNLVSGQTYILSGSVGDCTIWIMRSSEGNIASRNGAETTFTANGTETKVIFEILSGKTLNNAIAQPMISTSGGDYEPYTGNAPSPSPSYPQDIHNVSGDNTIEICGKNLFGRLTKGYIGNNGEIISGNTNDKITPYIPTQANETYWLTGLSGSYSRAAVYDQNKNFISEVLANSAGYTRSFITPNNACYLLISVSDYSDTKQIQLEKNNEATTYESYTGNSQLISLGVKNLLTLTDGTFTDDNNLTVTIANGKVTLNGSTNANYLWLNLTNKDYRYGTPNASNKPLWFSSTLIEKGQYSISSSNSNITSLIRVMFTDVSAVSSINLPNTTTKDIANVCIYIASSGTTFDNETFDLQITKGSTPQYVSASPIELCKIGTYQDYIYKENDRWFLHKEIGKVVLDGSESWYDSGGNAPFGLTIDGALITNSNDNPPMIYCNNFIPIPQSATLSNYKSLVSTSNITTATNRLKFRYTSISTLANWQTWLSTHNTIVYYVLATPTDTEITDTTLLEQLETIKRSYDGVTNISQENNDLPFILDVSALKEWNNE